MKRTYYIELTQVDAMGNEYTTEKEYDDYTRAVLAYIDFATQKHWQETAVYNQFKYSALRLRRNRYGQLLHIFNRSLGNFDVQQFFAELKETRESIPYTSVTEMKEDAREIDYKWFQDAEQYRRTGNSWFNSIIYSGVYGGHYFVESVHLSEDQPREWRVIECHGGMCNLAKDLDGNSMDEYGSRADAIKAIKAFLKEQNERAVATLTPAI